VQAESDADRERERLEGLGTRREQLRDRIGELEGELRRRLRRTPLS
jgi:hypothetical protein